MDQGTEPLHAPRTVIIGAGPAGLSCSYELLKHGVRSTVLEQDSIPGGLARTERYKGYCFDIGGHRFFTKVAQVQKMWREVLGPDFLKRPRLSRIYYRNKFFQYPIEPLNAMKGLGAGETLLCGLSYLKAKAFPPAREESLEDWLTARFGERLYRTFFKTYTEKVWGVPCTEIGADWAAQRIRGLSVSAVLRNALRRGRSGEVPKTLIQEFDYPRLGPGMMWTRTMELLREGGSEVRLDAPVRRILWEPGRVLGVRAGDELLSGDHFVSSMPVRDLIEQLDPEPPEWLQRAAHDFHYRDFLTVVLIVKGRDLFPDNWIYVHDPGVKVGRIQNYNNWSPHMVPDPATTCLGLEYFCFEGDSLWRKPDEELLAEGRREVAALGLVDPSTVVDGTVLRVIKAYPVYDARYKRGLEAVRRFLAMTPNLQLVGRNGMHRYNNQDHSMLTGMLAARNILGQGRFDLWRVNADTDYHEDGFRLSEEEVRAMEQTQPRVPSSTGF
jgi:protoporphyrinogen oxidase